MNIKKKSWHFRPLIIAIMAFGLLSAAVLPASADNVSNVLDSAKTSQIEKTIDGNNKGSVSIPSECFLSVRSGAGNEYPVIGSLAAGSKIDVISETLGWYKINFQGGIGYVNAYYISGVKSKSSLPDVYGIITIPDGEGVSLRTGAGYNCEVAGKVNAGTRVKVLDKQNGWYKIEYSGINKPLWVNGAYVKLIDSLEETLTVTETDAYVDVRTSLNFRSGPSLESPILRELDPNVTLKIIEVCGDWYKVKLSDGSIGYCYAEYIKKGKPTITAGAYDNVSVSEGTSGGKNVLESMTIPSDAAGLTPEIASQILAGLGYKTSNLTDAIKKFQNAALGSWSKNFTSGSLDEATRAAILKHAKMAKEALAKYPENTISKSDSRFQKWVSNSASCISNMPALKDKNGKSLTTEDLVNGILVAESGKYHWKDRKFIASGVGATGFMQIMPFHADSAGNIYDPEVNLAFGAKYINTQLARTDWQKSGDGASELLAKSLAAYNGGPNRSALKNLSWEQIVKTAAIPTESINYAINIRKNMGLSISAAEQEWLNNH